MASPPRAIKAIDTDCLRGDEKRDMKNTSAIAQHYERSDLGEAILGALKAAGKDVDHLTTEDLAPVDEFHTRGRPATVDLARLLSLNANERVLDLGCGIGGPSRYLAKTFGCRVVGVDLMPEFCRVAAMLAERTGLADRVEYRQGDALAVPFEDQSFDVVWSQNVVMNIADRDRLSVPKTPSIGFAIASESEHDCWMFAIAFLFVRVLCDGFKSRRRLEAEILVLRHQLNVLQQRAPRRLYLTWADRALFVWLYRGFPRILDAIMILRPETIVRWHRKGFRCVLAMEIPPSRWPTADRQRAARPYPKNELREPALGCAAYPRRASEARLRRRPVDSLEVHGTEARSTVANMEDLPSQPR